MVVKRDHYDKLVCIREFLEQLTQDCFNNIFHQIGGPQKITHLPLMRLVMEIQFLLSVHLIFPVVFLSPQRSALFRTFFSTVPHQYLLILRIFPKMNKLNREEYITDLLLVTVQLIFPIKIDASR